MIELHLEGDYMCFASTNFNLATVYDRMQKFNAAGKYYTGELTNLS